jgi:predicted nucleic acid-binding protein
MRIFLDANILFSAAKSDGAMRRLLALLRAAGHELCADGYVIEEARRNLAAKANSGAAVLEELLRRVRIAPLHPATPAPATRPPLPEKDRPVLAAAIQLHCDALLTGDRAHFGKLLGRTISGVAIHSPRSLAETILKRK